MLMLNDRAQANTYTNSIRGYIFAVTLVVEFGEHSGEMEVGTRYFSLLLG